jgi:flavin reductase (DIM6/NTAB) family NADH-FMN oxidoreductase RutF
MSIETATQVLGRIPSGIFILTAKDGDHATGMLASWVQQAGFEPPAVTVAVRKDRYVCEWLSKLQPFVLNIVGAGEKSLMKHFAQGFEPGEPAFDGLETTPSADDVPILAAAIGHLACKPLRYVDSGDHRIILAEVSGGGSATESPGDPKVHVRKTGAHY